MRSKKIKLGFVVVNTRTGEWLSAVFARRDPARDFIQQLTHDERQRVGIHTIEAYVPVSWQRGDSLEPYVDAELFRKLNGVPHSGVLAGLKFWER